MNLGCLPNLIYLIWTLPLFILTFLFISSLLHLMFLWASLHESIKFCSSTQFISSNLISSQLLLDFLMSNLIVFVSFQDISILLMMAFCPLLPLEDLDLPKICRQVLLLQVSFNDHLSLFLSQSLSLLLIVFAFERLVLPLFDYCFDQHGLLQLQIILEQIPQLQISLYMFCSLINLS